jgi:hypothetical protein
MGTKKGKATPTALEATLPELFTLWTSFNSHRFIGYR